MDTWSQYLSPTSFPASTMAASSANVSFARFSALPSLAVALYALMSSTSASMIARSLSSSGRSSASFSLASALRTLGSTS